MDVGVHIPFFGWPEAPQSIGPTLASMGAAAEAGGVTSISLMDHWFQMDEMASATDPMLDGYTALGFLAAHTSTVRLGLLVTGVTYRPPGLLAKTISTLDVLSGGRAQLGIGAAWYEREHLGLGVPFPPVSERFERLEEAIQVCLQMWSDDDGPYDGTHYRLAETINSPQPISRPRPSIMIGGSGERKTLRLVARYADACNLAMSPPDEVAHKLDVLRSHCADEGRDDGEIEKTYLALIAPDVTPQVADEFAGQMASYAALGIERVMVMPLTDDPVGFVERVGQEVVPRLADL